MEAACRVQVRCKTASALLGDDMKTEVEPALWVENFSSRQIPGQRLLLLPRRIWHDPIAELDE